LSGRSASALILATALAFAGVAVAFEGPLRVVTTSTDLKSLVEAVGGADVVVESLAPPIGDPHAVDLKPAQIAHLTQANLVFRIGLDHEPWLSRARVAVPAVDCSKGVTLLQAQTPRLRADARPHVHGFGNTHYWLDPENARPITATIFEALSHAVPSHAPIYEENRRKFLARLDAGLARWREAMAPYKGTRIVVVHETWPYFAARFGLAIVAAAEPVPGVPPTPSEIATLIVRMREMNVRVLLIDPYTDERLFNPIARATVARVVSLVPSVGAEPEASDYIALFDLDVRRFREAMESH
jgi:ABC-type Zn uptake system ZnuABC Zn-binding protein ZnuA